MISLVRSGPESYILHATGSSSKMRAHLSTWGSKVDLTPEEALGIYGNNRYIVFFEVTSEFVEGETERETYVSENTFALLLCSLINDGLIGCIDEARPLPGYITMRLLGDVDKGIDAVRADLGGEIISALPQFRRDIPETASIIYFTKRALNKVVPAKAMNPRALLVTDRSKGAIMQYLMTRGISYLGDSLGTPDWKAVEIKIYDANGYFDMHRKRLWAATQGLQTGVVLEERWGKDQAMMMMSVPIYMLKIFTPIDVREIKRTAMALEYDSAGQRFADFDVFYEDRKVSAYTELEAHPGMTRNDIGMMFRNQMIRYMDFDSRNELLKAEDEIRYRVRKNKIHKD